MNEPPVCVRCGLEYDLREDCDPSPMCDLCAQQTVPELVAILKSALEESGCDGDLCAHKWHEDARAAIARVEGDSEEHLEAPTWLPVETMPKVGEFLIAVWEGDWTDRFRKWRVYHAASSAQYGLSWAMKGQYRVEEGGAYKVVGWMPLPEPPPTGETK